MTSLALNFHILQQNSYATKYSGSRSEIAVLLTLCGRSVAMTASVLLTLCGRSVATTASVLLTLCERSVAMTAWHGLLVQW